MHVVDRNERQAAGRGEGLGGLQSAEQRSHEPRPLRDGDGLELIGRHARAAQRIGQHRAHRLHVLAGGELRHHATVGVVHALRGDRVAEHPVAVEHSGAGVIAGGLDGEEQAHRPPSTAAGSSPAGFQRAASRRSGSGTSTKLPWRVPACAT